MNSQAKKKLYAGLLLFTAMQTPQAFGQRRALNPSYLGEFPAVDRILRDNQADDPLEKAARQMGALLQMNHIIEDLSEGRAARNEFTYDETVKLTEYKRAQVEIRETLQNQTTSAARGYDSALSFRQELLRRYFSPALQAQWAVATARAVATVPAASPRAPQSAKPTIGPPDTGIVKARAANVDTKVFGIPLGEPLSLPKCDIGLFGNKTPLPCFAGGEIEKMLSALTGVNLDAGGEEFTVMLADSICPTWMTGCSFTATIRNGRFIAAYLNTKGRDVEKTVGAELQGKYGSRASMQQRIVTPNNGSKQFDVWDLDWELPGLHVEYKVLDDNIFAGHVLIESEGLYNRRKAKAKEAARPKL